MNGIQTQLEKLRREAAECLVLSNLAKDPEKQQLFARVAEHITGLAAAVQNELATEPANVVPAAKTPVADQKATTRSRQMLPWFSSSSDLSERLSRTGKAKAADAETTVEMLIKDLSYSGAGDEPGIESLVIVDETFGTGKTVAAILAALRANGLPNDCKVTVATALKVRIGALGRSATIPMAPP